MRANWGSADWQETIYGPLSFTPQQADVVRAELSRRTREDAGKAQCGEVTICFHALNQSCTITCCATRISIRPEHTCR